MSLEFTERVLFTSPTRKPIDAECVPEQLTPLSVTVSRLLSGMLVSVTVASAPADVTVALPTAAAITVGADAKLTQAAGKH